LSSPKSPASANAEIPRGRSPERPFLLKTAWLSCEDVALVGRTVFLIWVPLVQSLSYIASPLVTSRADSGLPNFSSGL
jgi:hypothetical protein